MNVFWRFRFVLAVIIVLIVIVLLYTRLVPGPEEIREPLGNFDAETQSLISRSERVVFLIPFSHWDTDWHDSFDVYSKRADGNILKAIEIARQNPRYRFSLEQVLFVQHFWETHPASRADLRRLIQNRQLTFAWGGITQPETSLVAPSIQVRNLKLGEAWIAETFGEEYVPRSAWQSDAFGNSAALPVFLNLVDIFLSDATRDAATPTSKNAHRCRPRFIGGVPLRHSIQRRDACWSRTCRISPHGMIFIGMMIPVFKLPVCVRPSKKISKILIRIFC
jgi:hypothetical protein